MKIEDILNRLCHYDIRNPEGIKNYMDKDEIKERGYSAKSEKNCYCDNCFYGRTKLAEYIIKLKQKTLKIIL